MNMKKIIASVATIAMAASAMSINVSAISTGTVIDFEDGDCSFVYMNNDDPKDSGGSDASVLSVEDYDGSKQLKVDVQNPLNVPKVWFDLDKIMPRENAIQISKIEFDATFVPKDSSKQLGWMGGAIGIAGGFDMDLAGKGQVNPSWSDGSWSGESDQLYVDGGIAKEHIERKILLPTQKYSEKGVNPFFGMMTWANQNGTDYVIYIDNITFTDADGNKIEVGFPAIEETTTTEEAADAVTEADATTDTAADDTDEALDETADEDTADDVVVADDADADVADEDVDDGAADEDVAVDDAADTAVVDAPAADAATAVVATGNTSAAVILSVMAVAGAAAIVAKKRK